MTSQYDDNYTPYDDERIKREVIIIDEEDSQEPIPTEEDEEEIPFADENETHNTDTSTAWMMFTSGRMLTDSTLSFRYFVTIAIMCFLSIFLTFMSLNANREYRQREQYASVLHERSVLKEEERYSLSSKSVVTKRLEQHGIKLIDLTKESRLLDK